MSLHRNPIRAALVVAATVALSVSLAGCSGSRPVVALADRVRSANSPIVDEIVLNESNPISQAVEGDFDWLDINLRDDATDAQILEFWCEVIVPGGGPSMNEHTLVIFVGTGIMPRPAEDACATRP